MKNNGEKRDFLKISKIYLALQGNGKVRGFVRAVVITVIHMKKT